MASLEFELIYAHSLPSADRACWETLARHAKDVADAAAEFAAPFGFGAWGRWAGLLHDIGKLSPEFQAYIRGERPKGGDHSSAGAQVALAGLPAQVGPALAFIVAGHHAGLADGTDLAQRLAGRPAPPAGWEAITGPLPDAAALQPSVRPRLSSERGFTEAFLIRMLFSCLVDADFLCTERFYAEDKGEDVGRGNFARLETLRDALRVHMAGLGAGATATPVNSLRARVLDHAIEKAALDPGLFTLTVPTGGGKTLASLSFALEHAVRHALRRVVYVIPFTSIIEQTAAVFREALGTERDILEHHASFDWEGAAPPDDEEGRDGLAKLRRAAENWDVPVVVTTAVQFFESLFANRTSRCRKLHNLAGSVIVLDEAQTLPVPLLRPCMAALDELARNYRASVVLCTATQPALRRVDGFADGFAIDDSRELAPDPPRLYAELKRVAVERLDGPVPDETIAARFGERPQMLCIVNGRRHAQEIFARIGHLPGAAHLTTLMCPRHRRRVLADLRRKLSDGEPARLVATSLVEAGVDISFPEVWRAVAGLDAIAQAAGRCNREGEAALGRVVVFMPAEAKPPRELKAFWQAAEPVLRRHADPLTEAAVRDYFNELYWQKGAAALDAAIVGDRAGILPALAERASTLRFPFGSIASAFRFIDDVMEPVVVPWRAEADDRDAEGVLERIGKMDRPLARDLRRLQQYVVGIPRKARDLWLARGVLTPVHPALGDALLRFVDLAHYDAATGVVLGDLDRRDAALNVF